MTFFTDHEVRRAAQRAANQRNTTVGGALRGIARAERAHYDVFLSQTARDQEIVLGVYAILTEMGMTVFVDWLEAPAADRADVTPENAAYIRGKMGRSDTLLFVDSQNADQSKWMCWEIGWFDAAKGRVAVLPVLASASDPYRGREFLGLYPYVDRDGLGQLRVSEPPDRAGRPPLSQQSMTYGRWRAATPGSLRPAA